MKNKDLVRLQRIADDIGRVKNQAGSFERFNFVQAVRRANAESERLKVQSDAFIRYRERRMDLMASTDPVEREDAERDRVASADAELKVEYHDAIAKEGERRKMAERHLEENAEVDLPQVMLDWACTLNTNDQVFLVELGLMAAPTEHDIRAVKLRNRQRRFNQRKLK